MIVAADAICERTFIFLIPYPLRGTSDSRAEFHDFDVPDLSRNFTRVFHPNIFLAGVLILMVSR